MRRCVGLLFAVLYLSPGTVSAGDITLSNTKNETNGDSGCEEGWCKEGDVCVQKECCEDEGATARPRAPGTTEQPACASGQVQNPFDVRNGNKFHRETLYVGGGEMPLRFELFYNSKHITTSTSPVKAIGKWTHTYWGHLRNPATPSQFPGNLGIGGQTVELRRPDGQSLLFLEPATPQVGYFQNVTSVVEGFFKATAYAGGVYTEFEYERTDGHIETYDSNGLLVKIRSRQGGEISLTRSADTPVAGVTSVTVTRSLGSSMTFTYTTDAGGSSDDSCFQCPLTLLSTASPFAELTLRS